MRVLCAFYAYAILKVVHVEQSLGDFWPPRARNPFSTIYFSTWMMDLSLIVQSRLEKCLQTASNRALWIRPDLGWANGRTRSDMMRNSVEEDGTFYEPDFQCRKCFEQCRCLKRISRWRRKFRVVFFWSGCLDLPIAVTERRERGTEALG